MRGNGPLTIAATRAGVWVFIPKLNDVVVIDAATRLVAQRASCTAPTDEIEPDPAVFELDGRSAEPSPPAHDNPAHGIEVDVGRTHPGQRVREAGGSHRQWPRPLPSIAGGDRLPRGCVRSTAPRNNRATGADGERVSAARDALRSTRSWRAAGPRSHDATHRILREVTVLTARID